MSAPDMSWVATLEHHARRTPDKAALVYQDQITTYSELCDRGNAVAAQLAQRGVRAGDVVALLAYNSADFIVAIVAANHLGAAAMPLNWRLAAAEVRFILEHSAATALICDHELLDLAEAALDAPAATVDDHVVTVRVSIDDAPPDDAPPDDAQPDHAKPDDAQPYQGAPVGWESFSALAAGTARVERRPAAGHDLHRLMYTSGTTGRPKGVMLSHANLAWKNAAHVIEFGFTNADIGLACGPLYHVGALDLVTTSMLAVGATTIVHRSFDADLAVAEIASSKVTTVWSAPAMVRAMLDAAEAGKGGSSLSSVRVIIAGGEKMPIPTIERIGQIFPSAWFADAYGLTETVSGDTFLDSAHTVSKLGSVGRPCMYLELDIWDESGASVPHGEPGEIVLRGPKVFSGYWRDEEATAAAFVGGWFHTGDISIRDADGFVYIVDRLKDMIVSGGENIASSEVERVIHEFGGIVETAVVGFPHERWGEVPVAFVVASAPTTPELGDALLGHCRERLAKFKTPTAVHFIDELPRNPSGKVLKRELRDRLTRT